MPGPGGTEVGRASLVVLPDLSKFTASLRKFVARIEKQVVVQLPTQLDPRGIQADVQQLKERIKRSPAQVPVTPAKVDEFARKVRADVQTATRTLEAQIPITADGERLRRKVTAEVEGIERLLSIDVPMDPGNAALFRRQVLDQVAEVQARVRTNPVEVPVTYDRSGLDRLQGALSRISVGGGESRGLSTRAKLYTAIGVAAAFSTPSILSLAGGLAQVVGVTALLPALLAGASVGIGTLVLGFQGFGNALKNMGDPKKFAESLKDLAPSARDTAKAINGLRPAFRQLRLDVQQRLFSGLGKIITRLSTTYLPVLTSGLSAVADAFNRTGKLLSGQFLDPRSIRDVQSILGDIAAAFASMAPGVAALSRAFLSLTQVAATFLPGLGRGFTDASKRFAAFIDRVRDSGALRDFIASGLSALSDVAKVLGAAGTALWGVISAAQAAGGGTLAAFAGVMQRIADVVNSPGFQAGLTGFFSGLQDGASAIADALPAVGQALSAIAPGLADLARAFGAGFGQLLKDVAAAFVAMAPTFNSIASALSQVNPQWLALALGAGVLAGWAVQLAPALSAVASALGAIISPVGLVAAAVAAVIAGFVLMYQYSQPVRDAFAGIISAAQTLWATVQPIFLQIAGIVQQYWPQIQATAQAVFSAVEAVVLLVLTNIRVQIQAVTAVIQIAWAVFGDTILAVTRVVFPAVLRIIQDVCSVISGVVRAFLSAVKGDWSGAWTQLKSAAAAAWDLIKTTITSKIAVVVAVVKTLGPKILAALGDFGSLLVGVGEDLMRGLARGIKNLATAPVKAVTGIAQDVLGAAKGAFRINSPSKAMRDIGLGLNEGLVLGIKQGGPQSVRQIRELADQVNAAMLKATSGITVAVGKATDKGFKLTKARTDVGQWISTSLLAGLTDTQAKVTSTVAQLTKKIQQVFVAAAGSSKAGQRQAVKDAAAYSRVLSVGTDALVNLAGLRERAADALKDAQNKLDTAIAARTNFRESITSATAQFGSITAAFQAAQQAAQAAAQAQATAQGAASIADATVTGASVSAADLVAGLTQRLAAIKQFAATLAQLRAEGLNDVTYQQVVQAGVEQGTALAQAIAAGGPATVTQINDLAKQIGDQATSLGTTAASELYDAGIAGMQGLVKGLESQAALLDAVAKRIGERLVAQVKKTLGIHSPSRVMAMQVGVPMAQGIVAGFQKGIPDVRRIVSSVVPAVPGAGAGLPLSLHVRVPNPITGVDVEYVAQGVVDAHDRSMSALVGAS